MRARVRFIALFVPALVATGCIGAGQRADPPRRADRAVLPDVVGLATGIRHGPCASLLVTLASGEVIEAFEATSLEGCTNEVTPVLLGHLRSMGPYEGKDPLVLAGTLDGATWIGTAQWQSSSKAWCVIFEEGEGAYREGDNFHLPSGLVIPAASDFRWLGGVDESEFLPLRNDDDLCLDEQGHVVGADVWNSH
jgi:hypothetical protein